MKNEYDFSKGKRGRVVAEPPSEPGKVRITIRLDELSDADQFGSARIRRGEDSAVGRHSAAHHSRRDAQE